MPDTDRLTAPISFLVCYDSEFEKVLELEKGVRAEGGLRIRPTRTFATIRHRLTPCALESCHHLSVVLRRVAVERLSARERESQRFGFEPAVEDVEDPVKKACHVA